MYTPGRISCPCDITNWRVIGLKLRQRGSGCPEEREALYSIGPHSGIERVQEEKPRMTG
jgi:hypothetical protein